MTPRRGRWRAFFLGGGRRPLTAGVGAFFGTAGRRAACSFSEGGGSQRRGNSLEGCDANGETGPLAARSKRRSYQFERNSVGSRRVWFSVFRTNYSAYSGSLINSM